MDTDNINTNENNDLVRDCKGTCKTPIGCTCKDEPVGLDLQATDQEQQVGGSIAPQVQATSTAKVLVEKNCDGCSKKSKCACTRGTHKLEVYDWMTDFPESQTNTQMVEVQFKNTRKGYYLNSNNLDLYKGDIVAVEATPGHDIGEVTLTGKLVLLQMKKINYRVPQGEQKRVYRIAKQGDIDKSNEVKALEHKTMLRAREIAEEIGLHMKISDVEYQGDGNKAIFYYIADERVDFRQLIKVYAEQFRVKIEMKQIGARQEAGRVGGIGPCGRELCCSSSLSNFVSVSTSAARFQDISLNPQKLAGQCGKLKCCLNYEVDVYVEAQRKLPSREIFLETRDGFFYHFKTDILSGQMTYSSDKHFAANLVTIDKDRVYDIIQMNKAGQRPPRLQVETEDTSEKNVTQDILEQENINRFDSDKNRKKKVFKSGKKEGPNGQQPREVKHDPKVVNANAAQQTQPQAEKKVEEGQSNSRNNNNRNKQHNKNRNRNNRNEDRPNRQNDSPRSDS